MFDFEEYIKETVDYREQVTKPEQINIDCINPDCDDNWRKRKKMTVNTETRIAYCFKCGKSYRPVNFVAMVEGISRFEAMKLVKAGRKRTFGPNRLENALLTKPEPEPATVAEEYKSVQLPFSIPIEPGSEPYKYLSGRNFEDAVIDHFGLRYQPAGPYGRRIIIPVCVDGRVATFQARALDKAAKPKYLFPREGAAQFQSVLYNWDQAKEYEELVLVEGVTDLWRLWAQGIFNVAGTFGKSLKKEQRRLILDNPKTKRVIVFWDGEALDKIYETAGDLVDSIDVRAVEVPDGMEPDTCPEPARYIAYAKPVKAMSPLERKLRGARLAK